MTWMNVMECYERSNEEPLSLYNKQTNVYLYFAILKDLETENILLLPCFGDDKYNGIGFRVDRVRINTTDDCDPGQIRDSNPFCSANIDVTNFLNLNSYVKHDDFCLAYIFTYRDFNGGTLGLAWVAEPGGSGGVCEKHRMMQEGSQNVKKSLNTGIVTLLNYGSYVALKVSQLTFAHEMGHNFGSKHDDDHKENQDCLPLVEDPKGNYIMFASATSGDKENNNKFSVCSRDSIARLLNRVTKGSGNCFLHQEGSFCGNKLAEDGEQCDCGYSSKDCQDKCCNPKMSNSPCKLTPKILINKQWKPVYCSPSAGECCTNDCQFQPVQHLCRTKGECHKAAYCNGTHTKCPKSKKVPDLTKCQDNTRVCKNGQCIGSICESVRGWHECSIVRSEKVTPEMMCFVACKENMTNAPCISTFDLQSKIELRQKYPLLAKELLLNNKPIQLKAGAPCDNYHGYCDAFLRCRSVEADGPLARIKNLIFSSAMLTKAKRWIMQFWWAVMLICVGGIIFVGIFLKLFSRSTPSSNPKLRKRIVPNSANHRRSDRPSEPRSRIEVPPNGITHPSAPPPRPNRQSMPPRKHTSIPDHNRLHRNRDRPMSLYQSNPNHSDASTRPLSMNFDSNVELHEVSNIIASHVKPSYPPPAYAEV
uniref:ADAM10 endopeptidase n=1 Tax=Schmidtea mediterranea TaxID=79327 RepID=I1ZIA5_SCHMD|nr:disintegrin and metalloproteinase domain containing protein-2 [Schmidtea mediterranea]